MRPSPAAVDLAEAVVVVTVADAARVAAAVTTVAAAVVVVMVEATVAGVTVAMVMEATVAGPGTTGAVVPLMGAGEIRFAYV